MNCACLGEDGRCWPGGGSATTWSGWARCISSWAAFGTDLAHRDALAVLAVAPTPAAGRRLSRAQLAALLRRAGRQRGVPARAEQLQAALRAPQLDAPVLVVAAWAGVVTALVEVPRTLNAQVAALEAQLAARFGRHPDAKILRGLPAVGVVLGAAVG
jgi:hypothetical protein